MGQTMNTELSCPGCGATHPLEVHRSVNADRHPDLRQAVLSGSLHACDCPCGARLRLAPELVYQDMARGQWLVVRPHGDLGGWRGHEEQAQALHAQAWGAGAPEVARELGAGLMARLVFGWAALCEKLLAREQELDDVTVELVKLALMRSQGYVPQAGRELRLSRVEGETLTVSDVDAASGEVRGGFNVPRTLYAEITSDAEAWAPLRSRLEGGLFVDVQRLFYDG